MKLGKSRLFLPALVAGVFTHAAVAQETYPVKAVRIVAGFPAGTGVDFAARAVAEKLREALGQPFIVENRPGASANIATELVARAPADGYTLLFANNSLAINPALYPKLTYDSIRDFVPISLTGISPMVLVAHPSLPAATVMDLVALAKRKPGEINLASAGTGSPSHLAGALFVHMTGISMVHVPYKGAPPALTDLLGGQVSLYISGLPPAVPMVRDGRVRALAVTTPQRSPAMPDVPTFAESGLEGYDVPLWYGVLAPARTPPEVIARLNAEIVRAMQAPNLRERFLSQGIDPASSSPGQFAGQIKAEIARWTEVVRSAGIKVE